MWSHNWNAVRPLALSSGCVTDSISRCLTYNTKRSYSEASSPTHRQGLLMFFSAESITKFTKSHFERFRFEIAFCALGPVLIFIELLRVFIRCMVSGSTDTGFFFESSQLKNNIMPKGGRLTEQRRKHRVFIKQCKCNWTPSSFNFFQNFAKLVLLKMCLFEKALHLSTYTKIFR